MILKNFLNILGVDMKTANEDACSMEHVLDGSTIKKLKNLLNLPKYGQMPIIF